MQLLNNRYYVQGICVQALARKYATPLYLYDAENITRQYRRFLQAFAPLPVKVKYACKALSNINILKLMRNLGADIDAVSLQEIEMALAAGFDAQQIIYTPNCVAFSEIETAVARQVLVNIDDLSTLDKFGQRFGATTPCCLRLNPNIVAGGNSKIQTGHIESKFGIAVAQLQQLLAIVAKYHIRIIGLHMHTGSDIVDHDVFLQMANILYRVAYHFPDLQFIDFGSGFKIAYHENDSATDLSKLGVMLKKSFRNFCRDYRRHIEIWFEPGKYLVSEAGYFLTTVNVIKQNANSVFAGVDSGQNHFLRPMFYNAYHRIINISNPLASLQSYNIVGYICEEDTFACQRMIPEIREGDILCFCNAGAYCFTMSSNYNSRLRPAEVLIYRGQDYLIRRRETLEDLMHKQVILDIALQ